MDSVAILVPLAGRCPHRLAAWRYVRSWYADRFPQWRICVGGAEEGQAWCKARAVARALRQTDARVLVVADADSIPPGLAEAVQQAADGASWAIPHRLVHRFDQAATARILHGEDPTHWPRLRGLYAQMPYLGFAGGGVTVVRREVYEEAPLDPRFVGWGQEDEAWAVALNALHGRPWRHPSAPLWHLWHPPQSRMSRSTGSRDSRALLHQYKRAAVTPGEMRKHLEPAREVVTCAASPECAGVENPHPGGEASGHPCTVLP